MTREHVRKLKRAVRASSLECAAERERAVGSDSALSLLARSIHFGHGRLAIVRLGMAVSSGARIAPEHWAYCARVAGASQDKQLQEMYLCAARAANGDC